VHILAFATPTHCRVMGLISAVHTHALWSGQGAPNALTGKRAAGTKYAPASLAHAETVVRSFYEFHVDMGTGPIVGPFPLGRRCRGRANAYHNPMEPWRAEAPQFSTDELRRHLYGLHAVLKLHTAQEEESYLSLGD
jgi:hypothetical protein